MEKNINGLLAVDIDGTLITDNGDITETVYNALEKAHSLNWEIVLATGRTFHAAKIVIEKLPFLKYVVLSNGACIIDVRNNDIVRMEKLPPAVVEKAVIISRGQKAIPTLYSSNIFNQHVYYDTVENSCEYFRWYIAQDKRCVKVDNVLDYTGDVLQMGMIDKKEVIFNVKKALSNLPAVIMALPFESTHFGGKSHDYWFIQVVGKECRKNIALRELAVKLNIPAGRLIAVGDNYNDADMIENADIGVAMGNAPDEIKKLAKVIVTSNNHSGLADVVYEVILSGKFFF